MTGRPNLQHRVRRLDDARYHGGTRTGRVLGCIWHSTAGDTADGARSWLDRLEALPDGSHQPIPPSKRASYHYLIDKDGTITRTVHPRVIAYHAGRSSWPTMAARNGSLNWCTIGVAFATDDGSDANPDDDALTLEQVESGLWLGSVLQETWGYPATMNFGHREVSPGRKTDPSPTRVLAMPCWREALALPEWPRAVTLLTAPVAVRMVLH